MSTKKRNRSIDIAKGIGIILVVLGHTMSPVMEGHKTITWLYKIIYTFHMPLFFFVSGVVASKLVTKPISKLKLVKQRAIRLMIPYVVWGIIYMPMKLLMKDQVRFEYEYSPFSFFIGNNPDGELWFLYVLFILSLIVIFTVNTNDLPYATALFVLVSIAAPFIPMTISMESISLSFSLYQSGFFFAGLLISTKHDYGKFAYNHILFFVSVIILVAYSIMISQYGDKTIYTKAIKAISGAAGVYITIYLSSAISKAKSIKFDHTTKVRFFRIGTCAKPIVPVLKITVKAICDLLSYIGIYSMEIFLIHAPILVVGRILLPKLIPSTVMYIILLTVISILASVLIAQLIKKIKIARLLLLGSK